MTLDLVFGIALVLIVVCGALGAIRLQQQIDELNRRMRH